MKILSVSGRNLASLDGEFAIDFQNGALGRAGLFAITGPTGAGKSTILDALCVALFDKTPRLSDSGGALIGRDGDEDRLGSNDVRSLLRRGSGSGYAQVVFVGRDGQSYQARWTVRKARDSAKGRFQNQSLELRNLTTGQGLGGTKTETLKCIQDLVGLTYEQFCRSVLLAQGDFAAFLKAGERDRSDLLERITGTQIYGRISMAAYRRMKEEEQLLARLESRRGAIVLLDAEQRRLDEEGMTAMGLSLKNVLQRMTVAERAGDWYLRRAALRTEVEQAAQKKSEAESDWTAAGDLRLELVAVEKAQPLRGLVTDADGAQKRVVEAGLAVADQAGMKASADESLAVGRVELDKSQAVAVAAETELAGARPLIAKAIELDVRTNEAASLVVKSRGLADLAEQAEAKAKEELDEMQARGVSLSAQVASAKSWLDDNRSVAPLATEWNRWHQELKRYGAERLRHDALAETRMSLLDEEERTQGEIGEAREVLTALVAKEKAAKGVRDADDKEAAGIDTAALTEMRGGLEGQRDTLKELAQLNHDIQVDLKEQQAALVCLQDEKAGAAQAVSEWQQAARDLENAEVALNEAERALLHAQSARNMEEQRGELREGEPCPLCGSHDHPWATGSPVAGLVKELEKRVGELRSDKSRFENLVTAGRVREDNHLTQAGIWEARVEEFANAARVKQASWGDVVRRVDGNNLSRVYEGEDVPGMVVSLLATVEKNLAEIRLLEQKAQALAEVSRKSREAHESAVSKRERATEALGTLEKRCLEVSVKRGIAELDLKNAEQECTRILETLAEPFAATEGWRARLINDPEAFINHSAAAVANWNTWSRKHDEADKELSVLNLKIEGGQGKLEALHKDRTEKAADLLNHEQVLEQLRIERMSFFEGRPVADVEAELTGKQVGAQSALKTAREEIGRLEREYAGASAALGKLEESLGQLREAAKAARASLDQELARQGLDEDTLRRQLLHDHIWITGQRESLNRLDSAVQTANIVLDERQRALLQHDLSGVPELAEDAVAAEKEAAEREKSILEQRQFEIRHRLEVDDDARKQIAELLPLIAVQTQKYELWGRISEVIGSADGKKFRTYAQSLTLEVLLCHANEHLKSLAPRYAVVRVPSSEMELQMIDQDMGDEVRSVNSLSGGESFLVSLALALGLSSLSSHTTRVESLFIDEGFGSLDPDTLEVALATLDSLQASGRKVGIISHVPGLAERIGVRIDVAPAGGGRSRVRVLGV